MKTGMHTMIIALALLAFLTFNVQFSIASAQGSLTPAGPPAPVMKSLAQIEPRTPISGQSPFTITQSGSYYLTTNLAGSSGQSAITISANNVTLDLKGFSLFGVSTANSGIYITSTNVTVCNGIITGWNNSSGFSGIECLSAQNVVLEHLTVFGNYEGLQCFANNVVIRDCLVCGNTLDGIYVGGSGCLIIGNSCAGNNTENFAGGAGIAIAGSNNRVEGNHVSGDGASGYGILIVNNPANTNNIVVRNSVDGSANNYSFNASENDVGPVGTAATATSPWANISN